MRSITLTATGYSPDPRENGGYTVTAYVGNVRFTGSAAIKGGYVNVRQAQ